MVGYRPNFDEFDTQRVFDKTDGICGYCGTNLIFENRTSDSEGAWHIDHIKPLANGGHPKHLNNLIAACVSCNLKKGKMSYSEFAELLENEQPGLLDDLATGFVNAFVFASVAMIAGIALNGIYNIAKSYFTKHQDRYY